MLRWLNIRCAETYPTGSIFNARFQLIGLLERAAVLPSLRTLIKARQWEQSQHLDLLEELMSECELPDGVHALIKIMAGHPEKEWCKRYVEETGLTDRSYRRHKEKATQIVECQATQDRCPNVRSGSVSDLAPALSDNWTANQGIQSSSRTRMEPATQVANRQAREAG